jgi:hypothetical protein
MWNNMEKCKIRLIVFALAATVTLPALAQLRQQHERDKDDRHTFDKQAFQDKRNAFIVNELQLSEHEADMFIPVDNELKQKLFEIGKDCRKLDRECRKNNNYTTEAYAKLVDCRIKARLKEAQLEIEYYEKFKQILSAEKLYKYQQADMQFMREFIGNEKYRKDEGR